MTEGISHLGVVIRSGLSSGPGVRMRFFVKGRVISAMVGAVLLLGMAYAARASEIDEPLLLRSTLLTTAHVYRLRMHHLHTDEDIDVVYRVGNLYIPTALDQLNHFLRDHRTDTVSHYDPREFDVLNSLMAKLGRPNGVIDIVCGYRTPWSNALLRHGSVESGVAEHSQHMAAKAIDIRVPGVSTKNLRNTALSLDAGGVGYYPRSQFVHVDVGPVREWSFSGSRHRVRMVRTRYSRHRRGRRGVIRQAGN